MVVVVEDGRVVRREEIQGVGERMSRGGAAGDGGARLGGGFLRGLGAGLGRSQEEVVGKTGAGGESRAVASVAAETLRSRKDARGRNMIGLGKEVLIAYGGKFGFTDDGDRASHLV